MARRIFATWLLSLMMAKGQTQLDLNRQVRNTLPILSGGTSAASQIDARRNVGTPNLVATDFPGADIGAQVNAAFASFGAGRCGTVVIPAGQYTYSTSILVPSGCTLEGGGRGWAFAQEVGPNNNSAAALVYNGSFATSAIYMMDSVDTAASNFSTVKDLAIRTNGNDCPSSGNLEWDTSTSTWRCVAYGPELTVTNTTNATPIVVTTSAAHNLTTGDRVLVSGVYCSVQSCAANGHFAVTVTGPTTFSLNGSVGNGAYQSNGTVEKLTWSAATGHLAAIQHGHTDPTATRDGRWNRIENVYVQGVTSAGAGAFVQGGFHFGVYLNGCEDCLLKSIYVNGADFGFSFGPASQPITALNLSARVNRLAGYVYRFFNNVTCTGCLAESNQWFARSVPGHTNARRYGAGVRAGGLYPGDTTFAAGLNLVSFYVEANDIDFLGDPNNPNASISSSIGSSGFVFQDRGNFSGRIDACSNPIDSTNTRISGVFTTGCTFSGAIPTSMPGGTSYLVVQNGPGQSQKVTDFQDTTQSTPYELNLPATVGGHATDLFLRSNSGGLRLHPHKSATAAFPEITGTFLDFSTSSWNGASADVLTWKMQATKTRPGGSSDTATNLAMTFGSGQRNFAFRSNSVFRVSHNNASDTPSIEIGTAEAPAGHPVDNTSPSLVFNYKSSAGATWPHITSVNASGGGKLALNTQVLEVSADPFGASAPITLLIKPGSGQGNTHLQEWQDPSGSMTSYVSATGAVAIKPSGTKPACDATTRFLFWTTAGGAATKDQVDVCAKDAADLYAWRAIF